MYSCTTPRPLARVLALGLTAMLVRAADAVKAPVHIVHLMADVSNPPPRARCQHPLIRCRGVRCIQPSWRCVAAGHGVQ